MSIHLYKQLSLFAGARANLSRSSANASGANPGPRTNASAFATPGHVGQTQQPYRHDLQERTTRLVHSRPSTAG